jgi:heme A synthase
MHFPSPGVSRLAAISAGITLVVIAAGAVLTSDFAMTPPLPVGQAGRIHEYLAGVVGAFTVLLLIWLLPTNSRTWVRGMAWAGVGIVAIEGALSSLQVRLPLSLAQSFGHAIFSPLLMAVLVALACFTAPEWQMDPDRIDLTDSPLVPRLAKLAPALVLLQICMGVAYRHKQWGVLPHMAGAMLVAIAMLVVPVILLQRYPTHPSLRPLAAAAMSIVLLQVTLGIVAFVMRLLDFDTSTGFIALTAAHACVGSLTLAASLALAIEVARCES